MTREIKDALKQVTQALPAANANGDSATLNLEQPNGGALENVEVEIYVPATTTLVHTKTLTFTVKHGVTAGSLAALSPQITAVITGKAGNGSDEARIRFRLPPGTKQFIAINAAVENGGGTNTATSYTASLLF